MEYQVEVECSPAHELIVSLDAFQYASNKGMDFGAEWVEETRTRIGAERAEALQWVTGADPFALSILAWQAPGQPDPAGFMEWLSDLSPGQLYERTAPYVPVQKSEFLRDLGQWKVRVLELLRIWHEGYFQHVEPTVLSALAGEAARRREQARTMPAVALIEEATTGLLVESAEVDKVLLIPQIHFRPLNRYSKCNRLLVCHYPIEVSAAVAGQPGNDLMRLVRALADENRLRIMHFLADGLPHSFTDVHKHMGLAKNTVHYHMSALRTAGLVRFHITGECEGYTYTARRSALDEIGPRLHRFLDER